MTLEKVITADGTLSVVCRDNMLALRNEGVGYSCIYTNDSTYQPIYISIQRLVEEFAAYHKISNALILGGGCCTIPRFMIKRFANSIYIDVIEYLSEVIALTQKYFLNDLALDRLNLIETDAFEYVHTKGRLYDFVMVDLFVGDIMAERVRTKDFIIDLESRLSNKALIAVNAYKCSLEVCREICKLWNSTQGKAYIVKDDIDDVNNIILTKGAIDNDFTNKVCQLAID